MPPLEPREHRISLADALAHIRRHRAQLGKPAEGDHGETFPADQVLAILAQPGCASLRLYHGRNEQGHRSIILVGADKDGADMEKGLLCEMGFPCPPWCADGTLARG